MNLLKGNSVVKLGIKVETTSVNFEVDKSVKKFVSVEFNLTEAVVLSVVWTLLLELETRVVVVFDSFMHIGLVT